MTEHGSYAAARAQMSYDARRKSTAVAYLLWFFLGGFGAHRFYLGRVGSGAMQLALLLLGGLLSIVLVGFALLAALGIWWIVDAFLIPGIAREDNLALADTLIGSGEPHAGYAGPARFRG